MTTACYNSKLTFWHCEDWFCLQIKEDAMPVLCHAVKEIFAAIPVTDPLEMLPTAIKAGFNLESQGHQWYIPVSLERLQSLLQTDEERPDMHRRKHFPSDIATFLSVDAMVDILTGDRQTITLEFLKRRPPLVFNSVLLSIKIPCWKWSWDIYSNSKTYMKLLYETYRAAPCPIGNAISYMNAAFLAEVSFCKDSALGLW
ncbi:hypothetical protein V6N12_022908 [Hibiscus sabdariffa]|uniref:Uncharacterized protein n=1 Tax=Hibiscus sabdariffa TaxID=183260 RepID=A0ABR2FW37_9ROSI